MRSRRFLLLATVLVALNIALWLVPQGLALQRGLVSALFGKTMVRADIVRDDGSEGRGGPRPRLFPHRTRVPPPERGQTKNQKYPPPPGAQGHRGGVEGTKPH